MKAFFSKVLIFLSIVASFCFNSSVIAMVRAPRAINRIRPFVRFSKPKFAPTTTPMPHQGQNAVPLAKPVSSPSVQPIVNKTANLQRPPALQTPPKVSPILEKMAQYTPVTNTAASNAQAVSEQAYVSWFKNLDTSPQKDTQASPVAEQAPLEVTLEKGHSPATPAGHQLKPAEIIEKPQTLQNHEIPTKTEIAVEQGYRNATPEMAKISENSEHMNRVNQNVPVEHSILIETGKMPQHINRAHIHMPSGAENIHPMPEVQTTIAPIVGNFPSAQSAHIIHPSSVDQAQKITVPTPSISIEHVNVPHIESHRGNLKKDTSTTPIKKQRTALPRMQSSRVVPHPKPQQIHQDPRLPFVVPQIAQPMPHPELPPLPEPVNPSHIPMPEYNPNVGNIPTPQPEQPQAPEHAGDAGNRAPEVNPHIPPAPRPGNPLLPAMPIIPAVPLINNNPEIYPAQPLPANPQPLLPPMPVIPPIVPSMPAAPMPTQPQQQPKKAPRRRAAISQAPQNCMRQQYIDLLKWICADRDSAYLVRFGKQQAQASKVELHTQSMDLPENIAKLRDKFVDAHSTLNMTDESEYQKFIAVYYEIIQAVRAAS